MSVRRELLTDWLFALLCWMALIWRIGYFFGDGDHEEVLGQILYRAGEQGLGNDFLIKYIAGNWTVRSPFVYLNAVFAPDYLEPAFLLLHLLLNLCIFFFMIRIGRRLTGSVWSPLLPLGVVFVFYAKSPGANDFYSPQLIPETFSMCFGFWALSCYFGEGRGGIAYLLALAVFFHPIHGAQISVLLLVGWLISDPKDFRKAIKFMILPLAISAVYVGVIFNKSVSSSINTSYFDLLVLFRNPHHYWPLAFPREHVLLASTMFFVAFLTLPERHRIFGRVFLIVFTAGAVFYFLSVYFLHSATVVKTQWFKSSIWLRFWFGIGLLHLAPEWKRPSYRIMQVLAAVCIVALFAVTVSENERLYHKSLRKVHDPELVDIGVQAAGLLPVDALLVQPMDVTGFQAYAKRGCYVNFKSILHYPDFLNRWYGRLEVVYGTLDMNRSGFKQFNLANSRYESIDSARAALWKQEGITHALTRTEQRYATLRLLTRNAGYFLYEL